MGTRFSISGGRNRGDLLGVALAASCESTIVIFAVWAITDGADHTEGVAVVRVVTPRIAVGTQGGSNFHGCLAKEADHVPNIEGAVNEGFHLGACLQVPDVEVDYTCVGLSRVANNPGWSGKANAVLVDRRGKNEGGIL